ncbi:MAG: T9SS type A sorting domain-containing protein [candidate division WOR-3 bacterium]
MIWILVGSGAVEIKGPFKDPLVKKETGQREVQPLAIGGPDAYGYIWDDGVAYEWLNGTSIISGSACDDCVFTISLPFPVTFYGNTYTSITVSTNGWASFNPYTSSYLSNTSIPNSSDPNNLLAVLWDDLVVQDGIYTATYGSSPNRKFVIEWRNVRRFAGSGNAVFEIIIYEQMSGGENIIRFSYNNDSISPLDASIGIENSTGTIGLGYTGSRVTGTSPTITAFSPTWTVEWRKDPSGRCIASGGPDAFGYQWQCVSYSWINGTNLLAGSPGANDATWTITLPFAFDFYGSSYTTITVSSNGWIGMGTGYPSSYFSNSSIPNTSAPNNIIAVMWDDLVISSSGGIYYYNGGSYFVIEWRYVGRFGASTYPGRFEIILYNSGAPGADSFKMVYQSAQLGVSYADYGGDATIGIENSTGTIGLQYSYNTQSIGNNKATKWWKEPPADYSPAAEDWKQYRHDYRRTGRSPLRGVCSSPGELYDVVHGSIDISIIATRVNADADHDIIAAQKSSGYGVAAFDGNTGTPIWDDALNDYYTSPGIASVAASERYVFSNGYSYFGVLNLTTGATVYTYDKPDARDASPLIADINADGCPEVFTSFGNTAVSVNGCATSYTTNWTYTLPASAFAPALLNISGNWYVAYPLTNGQIYILSASTGSFHSSFSAGVPSTVNIWPDYTIATGNLDGTGSDEIVVPTSTSVTVYRWMGSSWTSVWSVTGLTNASPVALGDKDRDGLEDVWIVSGGELMVYRGTNGTLLGQTSGLGVSGYYGTGFPPSLFDFNNDGYLDALVPYSNYNVRAVNGQTMGILGTFGTTPYSITSEVIIIRLSSSEIGFSVGDFSCHITTWGPCPLLGGDDDLAVSEGAQKHYVNIGKEGITINTPYDITLTIYSLNGSRFAEYQLRAGNNTINLSNLPKGVYIVKVGKETYKFIRR